jgi:hypothetical protein
VTFTLDLHKSPISESPKLEIQQQPSFVCDPGAVAIRRKLKDMKREPDFQNKAAKQARLDLDSTLISYKDHNQKN